ncbi:sodium/potassium/calcium exchanger 1-like [Dicentrarchus labrax]|uniref:sodium/potassium/calcium exchanger 1-like n=1 Tax=Dicentrarchus labrax TaxID=13489 RepID=UPI0021F61C2B|nr:sodium/potassium/calcium exchanger 1-like [Dicentrarchus labrax]XP_051238574.1 sodium/potassium/calcium exchanger 1-like [Dicentrarchus labrax]XP_051238575.1 sodium/potassium/calcium exchanger 1-like [Dicentrarchus labrax]
MNCAKKKQRHLSRVLFLLSGVFLCTLYQLTTSARLYQPLPMPQIGEDFGETTGETQGLEEPLSATHELEHTDQTTPKMQVSGTTSDFKASTTESPPSPTTNRTLVQCIYVAPTPAPPVTTITPASPGEAPHIKGEYPEDLFSIEDRRRGWVILHIFGMMYMFISLAIVCDEFFVPALGVIKDKLAISDNVAGATFMAAGRSAPKLFTSLIGAFIAHSNVGIGTIVGSAVFNILFVIGMCALFSREVLHLTWWPLFRDVSFYILDLILLIIFFLDNVIMWWESMMLVTSYTLYVIFMKFNVQIEQAFKTQLYKHKNIVVAVEEPEKEDVPAGEDQSGDSEDAVSDKGRNHSGKNEDADDNREKEEERKDKPLSLEWPDTRRKQATYLFLLPIIFPLWLTVPDVRNQKSKRFFAVTFLGSILWIAVFSYLMVWWAHQVGETIGITEQIMGLTILAVGTSIPDLITSVIVARKGLGDMVVSSSVGRNIFEITVGLPVPWLLYSSIHGLAPVAVRSNGLFCAMVLLFVVLFFFIISIVCCMWKINKVLGLNMFLLYFVFVALSIMMQYEIIICPVSVSKRA